MPIKNKDFESFESEYHKEEKEILILTSDKSGAAAKYYNSWNSSTYFLAYVDVASNELKNGDGRINWLIPEEESDKHGISWPYYFKRGTIYRLKVRELIDKTVPEGRVASFYNQFMVLDVLEENAQNSELLTVLEEYRKPVKIVDETLGEFELNKDWEMFEGKINWIGEKVSVSLEVIADDKDSWTEAMDALRMLFEQQQQRDMEFRNFAAEQLTDLANDWREDEETAEISKNDFINRISLSELVVTSDGNFVAYYDDDDMFLSHVITVYGDKESIKSATIEG